MQQRTMADCWQETWKPIESTFKSSLKNSVTELQSFLKEYTAPEANAEMLELQEKTHQLCVNSIITTFHKMNWIPEEDDIFTVKSLCDKLGVTQEHLKKQVRFYFNKIDRGFLEKVEGAEETWIVKRQFPALETLAREADELANFLSKNDAAKVNAAILLKVSSKLPEILRGEQQPVVEIGEVKEYYKNHPCRALVMATMTNIAEQIFNRSKALNADGVFRFLEVHAGTGSLSLCLLPLLQNVWKDNFEYYFTDESDSLFPNAKQILIQFEKNMKFCTFKLEESPLFQGVPLGFFDCVAAVDLLHHSTERHRSHLRQVLKNGAPILFTETVGDATDLGFLFGLREDYRSSNLVTIAQGWESCGFEKLHSMPVFMNQFAVITATATAARLPNLSSSRASHGDKKRWIIFVEHGTLRMVAPLAAALVASGADVEVVVRKEDKVDQLLEAYHLLHPRVVVTETEEHNIAELFEEAAEGIIYGWGGLSQRPDQEMVAKPFLLLVQKILSLTTATRLKLFVLTRGSQAVDESGVSEYPSGATLLGMVRSLKNEQQNMFVRLVDLERSTTPEQLAEEVLYEISVGEADRYQVAYRGGVRFEAQFGNARLPTAGDALRLPTGTDRYKLRLPQSRAVSDLAFEPLGEMEPPQETQVVVRVTCYALNFRDYLTVIKPSQEFVLFDTLGLDFAGEVIHVGKRVQQVHVGDRVFGVNFLPGRHFNSHLTMKETAVNRVPDTMTDVEAVTLPLVFFTAYYCLITLAEMKRGDTVLIHTGSGGVGLAAIQLARHVGAKIISTAGNARKRAYLRSLGVEHVFGSRDTGYEQEILRVTQGRGVNIVLNSITGPGFKEATLRVAAKGSRFIEMSKLSTWTPMEVQKRRPDVKYEIIDLTTLPEEMMDKLRHAMEEHLAGGTLKSLPYVRYNAHYVREASQQTFGV